MLDPSNYWVIIPNLMVWMVTADRHRKWTPTHSNIQQYMKTFKECAADLCVCIYFTSLPRGIPLPKANARLMTLATKVLKVRYSFSNTPRRMVFISEIPEPVGDNNGLLQLADCQNFLLDPKRLLFTLQWTTMDKIYRCYFNGKSTRHHTWCQVSLENESQWDFYLNKKCMCAVCRTMSC